jgi:hypothetical protein
MVDLLNSKIMLTFDKIYSNRDSIENIRRSYNKDISSIDIINNSEYAAQIKMAFITFNDVYLPITDDCYLNIFSNGSYEFIDRNLPNLNYYERTVRNNVTSKIISEIMAVLG